ncbi:hypothetical protein GLAREA_08274 [Glarea lozoyensis ATCC 20868]|uniref:Uncharacterized protein n=1 Tax=Glarea lozoyensis (strain ATCC 20868 / MF5171) TaxID=1116229 RepID=S3CD10_GLAL2|nr:uncharacterized protein GLAREA_08274 [Glarea lozoyensis ATCC 20868]EPE24422.1 hypothetical protein GLAREA_08274 [Glarea lozoyensis ATCC 20868]
MDNSKKILYAPVQNNSEDDLALHEIRKPNKPRYRFQHFLLLEVIHLVLLLGGFVLYSAARRNAINSNIQPEARGLDTYFSLSEYSVVKEFYGDPNLVNTTAEAEALFDHIQTTDGIVALDTIWALKNGYAPSHAHPEDPTKSIYQIDMFHSMHCINPESPHFKPISRGMATERPSYIALFRLCSRAIDVQSRPVAPRDDESY